MSEESLSEHCDRSTRSIIAEANRRRPDLSAWTQNATGGFADARELAECGCDALIEYAQRTADEDARARAIVLIRGLPTVAVAKLLEQYGQMLD